MDQFFKILAICALVGLYVVPVQAETRVQGIMSGNAIWKKAEGPYLLTESVIVPDLASLAIEPGTQIGIAPEADTGDISYAPGIFVSGGGLSVQGSYEDHVSVRGLSGIFVANGSIHNGSADIAYADLSGGSRLSFEDSTGTIATSTISGTDMALYFKDSIISVWGSRIEANDIGIYVQPHKAFVSKIASPFGTGGIGNALDPAPDLYASSSLVITGSVIAGNDSRAVFNNSDLTVDARGNWWGDASGPASDGLNSVYGKVSYAPWLFSEPKPAMAGLCCSSVLFIPGLEATRLYKDGSRLWEPLSNSDVSKLKLTAAGSSTDPSIYSGGPIDKALGISDIYGNFMKFLDGLVAKGAIGEWKAFGYDWRKPIGDVAAGLEKKATTTESLLQTVYGLAARSKTGKVSLIAHSNGGLVAKYLVKMLADSGKANLIDSVISVAVPYLGTPEAIAALLHGDDQAILGGLILNKATARALGANMPSAYSLLPSRKFFSTAFGPVIAFASTSVASFDAERAFIADTANARKAPSVSNTKAPIKGNQLLLGASDLLHSVLDPFEWPAAIARWAIVGWGVATTKAIRYADTGHTLLKSPYGDGTVKAQSAAYNDGQVIPVDLAEASRLDKRDISHATILEASGTEKAIEAIVSAPQDRGGEVRDALSNIPAVSTAAMDWNGLDAAYDASRKELRLTTHSPVKLHAYDALGDHVGEIPLPVEAASRAEEGLYTMKEEKIPGSSYEVLGCESDTDCDTQITLPDTGQAYNVVVDGVGTGSFTLDVERIRGPATPQALQWKEIPVTPRTVSTHTQDYHLTPPHTL